MLKTFQLLYLKETTVQRLKNSYQSYMKHKKENSSCSDVQELPSKKMGSLLLIGEGLDKQVQEYVKYLHECGTPVNTPIVIAMAEGIITSVDTNLLACNGGQRIGPKVGCPTCVW